MRHSAGRAMTPAETLAVHQLLGRLVYFHVLLIEPVLTTTRGSELDSAIEASCLPVGSSGRPPSRTPQALMGTAWVVIEEMAAALPGAHLAHEATSCPVCRVRHLGSAIAARWIDAEDRAYAVPAVRIDERTRWSVAAGHRMAATFALQHGIPCDALAVAGGQRDVEPPATGRMPLTAELLALWACPTSPAPVTSWLNHCTTLEDISRVIGGGPR